jgi:uncharacterized protein YndB with AHSA1/START domain
VIQDRVVSASALVEAPAHTVFDLLASPGRHAAFDGSGSVRRLVRGPDRLFLGARFAMGMHLGVPYAMVNKVVEFEEGRRIAWTHIGRAIWRYELEPAGTTSTRVTESFDMRSSPLAAVFEATGFAERNERGIVRSLALLADVVRTAR